VRQDDRGLRQPGRIALQHAEVLEERRRRLQHCVRDTGGWIRSGFRWLPERGLPQPGRGPGHAAAGGLESPADPVGNVGRHAGVAQAYWLAVRTLGPRLREAVNAGQQCGDLANNFIRAAGRGLASETCSGDLRRGI
jgi:hypothetical protein